MIIPDEIKNLLSFQFEEVPRIQIWSPYIDCNLISLCKIYWKIITMFRFSLALPQAIALAAKSFHMTLDTMNFNTPFDCNNHFFNASFCLEPNIVFGFAAGEINRYILEIEWY